MVVQDFVSKLYITEDDSGVRPVGYAPSWDVAVKPSLKTSECSP